MVDIEREEALADLKNKIKWAQRDIQRWAWCIDTIENRTHGEEYAEYVIAFYARFDPDRPFMDPERFAATMKDMERLCREMDETLAADDDERLGKLLDENARNEWMVCA